MQARLRGRLPTAVDGGRARGGFTDVDTVASATMDAAIDPTTLGRAWNISDGTGTTWREYTNALAMFHTPGHGCGFPSLLDDAGTCHGPARRFVCRHVPCPRYVPFILLGQDQEFPTTQAASHFGFAPEAALLREGIDRLARG